MTFEPYTLSRIRAITGGAIHSARTDDPVIGELLIDSRRLVDPAGCLFIALVTQRNDGHKFIGELYEKGVRLFLIQDTGYQMPDARERMPDAGFILVPDTLETLQELAACHRSLFTDPVIGITGSNGKTIIKEWLFQLLCGDYRIIRSPRSFNSQIGVPLSVLKTGNGHNLAIFEAGISQPGEMEKLERIIRPGIGLITNIGHAHDEHFPDMISKTSEKLKLFTHSEVIIHCADHEQIGERIRASAILSKIRTFTWSRKDEADLTVTRVEQSEKNTLIEGRFQGRRSCSPSLSPMKLQSKM